MKKPRVDRGGESLKRALASIASLPASPPQPNAVRATESAHFRTAGDLRALLDGVPDDRIIMAQVVGSESGAWNMVPTFAPCSGCTHGSGDISVLTFSHPMLSHLPLIGDREVREDVPVGQTVRVRVAVAVDASGDYGIDLHDPGEAGAYLMGARAMYWIEADVPLPLPPIVVEGSVISAEEG